MADTAADEQRRDRERLWVLAESGRLLSGTDDLPERLGAVARAISRVVRAGVAITTTTSDGHQVPTVVTRADQLVGETTDPHPRVWGDLARRHLVEEMLNHSGGGVVAIQGTGRGDQRDDAQVAPWQSGLVTALGKSTSALGALVLLDEDPDRSWPADLRATIEELAGRICSAIEADRLARREHHLHEASAALAAAGTVPEAGHALAQAVQRALGATGVAVYTRTADDPDHLTLAYATGHDESFARHFGRLPVTAQCLTGQVARTGQPQWLSELDHDQRAFPLIEEIGGDSAVRAATSLPLRLHEQVTGVLTASFATTREFAAAERNFAQTLVGQAAHVLDRAATADARAEIAQTLQHALLPRRLPTVPRLALASHYQPAGRHTNAGGDWYDVIALDRSRVGLVVGDVTGSGPTAAAVMGQLRAALAGFLLEGHSCARALSLLDRVARQIDGATASTVFCMVLDVDTGDLRWARAGHLPALLLQPAGSEPATRWIDDTPGAALAVLPLGHPAGGPGGDASPAGRPSGADGHFGEGRMTLRPGASVVLFTDGLVERRGESLDTGLDRLAHAVADHADRLPTALLDLALAGSLDETVAADDVAVLLARFRPPGLRESFPSVAHQLRELRHRIRAWAGETGLDPDTTGDLQLLVGEAAANAIEHAYPPDRADRDEQSFHVALSHTTGDDVSVEVRDHGRWQPQSADRGFRGRGLDMIRTIGTDLSIDTDGGTTVTFVLPVSTAPSHPARPALRHGGPGYSATTHIDITDDGIAHLSLRGDFDTTTVGPVRDQLTELITHHRGPIEVDTADVTYLPSSGVRLLTDVVNSEPGRISLWARPHTLPQRILDIVGLPYSLRTD